MISNISVHDTILLAGGNIVNGRNFDSIGFKIQNIPPLPKKCHNNKLILNYKNKLMSLGGTLKKCYILEDGKWICHSKLNIKRYLGVFVEMPTGIFAFGGCSDHHIFEFLKNGSTVWKKVSKIPMIEEEKEDGTVGETCFVPEAGHKISPNEIILISHIKLMKFNIESEEFTEFLKLGYKDIHFFASVIFNGKVIITGGEEQVNNKRYYNYDTLIVDLTTQKCRKGGKMKVARSRHAMEVISIKNKMKLIAFGGEVDIGKLKSVEIFDEETETWTLMDKELNQKRKMFGHVRVSSTLFETLKQPRKRKLERLSTTNSKQKCLQNDE